MPKHGAVNAWAVLVLVAGMSVDLAAGRAFAAPPSGPVVDLVDRAKEVAAARTGATVGDLTVVNSATRNLPELKRQVHAFTLMNTRTGREDLVDLAPDGAAVDFDAVLADERAAKRTRLGALDERLAQEVAKAAPGDTFDVVIDLEPPVWDPPSPPSGFVSEGELHVFHTNVTAARQAVLAPVLQRAGDILRAEGVPVFRQQAEAAVVHATIPAAALQRLAKHAEFRLIAPAARFAPTLATSRRVIGADGVHHRGLEGQGVKIAAVEVGGGYATSNPYLAGVVQGATPYCAREHTTEVAGIIHSNEADSPTARRGIAPGSTLWVGGSCNGIGLDMHNAEATAHTWGMTVLNNSWGQQDLGPFQPTRDMQTDDRSEEEHVRDWRTTIVVSAGNRNGCGSTDAYVTSPAKAYSVITAGGSDTRGTPSWGDDVMYPCSSYVDPNSNSSDRQKPEVVAPATNVVTTSNSSPWFMTDSGTSFAAPMVASTAALLQQRDSRLKTEPEAVKAIIMASALSNIEGDVRLSNLDGAGSIRVDRADDIARTGRWTALSHTCASPGSRAVLSMNLEAHARTRVVIAWGEDSDDPSWPGQPNANIDLWVKDPTGVNVAWSVSYDNTYEIVDFYPSSSGTYTAHAVTARCSWNPRYLSGAWIQDPGFQPGLARFSAGSRLDAFLLGRDMAIWQRTNTGSAWTTSWNSLGKPGAGATSNPYAVWWQNNNRLDVFVQGSDGGLWQKFFCGSISGPACQTIGWSGWTSMGGILTEGPPTAAWTSGDRIDVFIRGGGGVNNVLWQYWDTPGGWHGWVDIGAPPGGATSAPAAVWWQNNTRMDVYARGTDYLLWSRYYCTQLGPVCSAVGWSSWVKVPLPGATGGTPLGSSPAVSAPTSGDRIDVFMRDTNNLMRQTYWSAATGGWSDWASLSGALFISGPGAAWWANNTKVDVLGQGTDNVLKQRSSAEGFWRDIDYLP